MVSPARNPPHDEVAQGCRLVRARLEITRHSRFVKGMHFSLAHLLPEFVRYDAWAQGTRFNLPVFLFQGENDGLTLTAQAKAFFGDRDAPVKRMELILDAGKAQGKIITAVARELLGFIWAIGTRAEMIVSQRTAA